MNKGIKRQIEEPTEYNVRKGITLEDIKTLNADEVQALLESKTKANLLKKCTDKNLINLFLLCATKFAFTDLELKTKYN